MISTLVLDVDGVLTDGNFLYNQSGNKSHKRFGPDDADALKLISPYVSIVFVSADLRGFPISQSRINDFGFELHHVPSTERLHWISSRYDLSTTCYFGDGIHDGIILSSCSIGIAASDSSPLAKYSADYITTSSGGNRAVAEAVLFLLSRYFPDQFSSYLSRQGLQHLTFEDLYPKSSVDLLRSRSLSYITAFNTLDNNLLIKLLHPDCSLSDKTNNVHLHSRDDIMTFSLKLVREMSIRVSVHTIATDLSSRSCIILLSAISPSQSIKVIDILCFNPQHQIVNILASPVSL